MCWQIPNERILLSFRQNDYCLTGRDPTQSSFRLAGFVETKNRPFMQSGILSKNPTEKCCKFFQNWLHRKIDRYVMPPVVLKVVLKPYFKLMICLFLWIVLTLDLLTDTFMHRPHKINIHRGFSEYPHFLEDPWFVARIALLFSFLIFGHSVPIWDAKHRPLKT